MPHVHFFLNPKGGTGKSLFSYVFAQYLMSKNIKTQCIDCDPVTPTLNKYKALDVLYMDIMEGNDIQKTKFDNFAQIFMQSQEDCHFVVDNGTSSYVALSEYLISNDFISVLKELGFDVSFHVIIVGGDNMEEIHSWNERHYHTVLETGLISSSGLIPSSARLKKTECCLSCHPCSKDARNVSMEFSVFLTFRKIPSAFHSQKFRRTGFAFIRCVMLIPLPMGMIL